MQYRVHKHGWYLTVRHHRWAWTRDPSEAATFDGVHSGPRLADKFRGDMEPADRDTRAALL